MMEKSEVEEWICSNCGGNKFEWGWVHHWGYGSFLRYSPLAQYSIWGRSGQRVKSRRCINCNQITFYCDPSEPAIQFSLRTLLIVITLIAAALGLFAYMVRN
jgi:hypothetical protein